MVMTVSAAVLRDVGRPLTIEPVTLDDPGPREVIVRTKAVGVCRSDLHFVDGSYPHAMPVVLGHEAAGVVEAVGSAVTRVKPGDHVVTCFTDFCGACDHCTTGHLTLCQNGSARRAKDAPPRLSQDGQAVAQFLNLSAFAEAMLVPENCCVVIDPAMPMDRAALLGCAVGTGAGAVFNACAITPGQSVAVIGCGGIGLAAINAAKIAGAGRIIAIDPQPTKRQLALDMGATDALAPEGDKSHAAIIAMTQGGVDYAIEAVGRTQTVELGWNILKRGGTCIVLGMVPPGQNVSLHGPTFLQGKTLKGSFLGDCRYPTDVPRLVQFYQDGRLALDRIIERRVPLADINAALDDLRRGDVARSVVVFP